MPDWINHKLESRFLREIFRYADDTILRIPLLKPEELKSFLMRVKEVSEKAGLKFNIKKKVRSWQLVP